MYSILFRWPTLLYRWLCPSSQETSPRQDSKTTQDVVDDDAAYRDRKKSFILSKAETDLEAKLETLHQVGFKNDALNKQLLDKYDGDVVQVVKTLLT